MTFILASIAVLGVQIILVQHSALALHRVDPAPANRRISLASDPITPTGYYTSYIPLIFSPEPFVSGHITDNGVPVANVLIASNSGRTTTTDANGGYQLYLPNGSHTITPTLAGYTFSPTFQLAAVPPSVTGLDFAATPPPCAAGATIFFDDFSNPNSGWGEQNTTSWYQHYTSGEYEAVLKVNVKIHHAAPGVASRTGNFVASVDMRQTDVPEYGDGYGLWIGSPSLGKYYEFDVATNTIGPLLANYQVTYYDANVPIWLGKTYGISNAVNMDNGINALRVHRCSTRYYFYANNTLLTSVILPELANQPLTAGFYARASYNATYRLDNFRIQTAP